ncbi:MAG: hypothetical protein LBG59_07440 [Candidatus Peribacteria bacterium]|nr:hypothetical protein [Candidatus Peribacteria bacterium]
MDTYHVTIQSINPRLCWFDNVADYDDAVDCIMGEIISEDEFRTKFFDENGKPDKKYINLDYVNITSTNIIEE